MAFQKHIASNKFTLGMRQDRTVFAQDPRSYREAWNGNIIFAGSGDAQFNNEPGNAEVEEALPDGYAIVGKFEIRDKTVVCSTNDTNSEIGLLELDTDGSLDNYTTLFNDEFDPNGDLLNFNTVTFLYPGESTFETIDKNRVYWLEPNNEPRCFNTRLGDQAVSPEFVDGSYTPLTATGLYPWFYSVHSMGMQADFNMGRIKLKTTAGSDGSLKTGMYEMTYRMVTRDGYATPWYPLTRHFFLTLDHVGANMHTRNMYASNVMTNKKFVFTVAGVDTRFYQLEMAYVFSTDRDVTKEASIFYREVIDPAVTDLDVTFKSTTGIPVNFGEFNRKIVPIRRGNAIGQKDNRLWIGGPTTYGPFKLDLDNVTIAPTIRQMLVDEQTDEDTLPLTNTNFVVAATVAVESYRDNTGTAINESHDIDADFPNYKGVQYEHLFASFWRDETYPFYAIVFDLKGNPFYAQHIRDYKFPKLYDSGDAYQLMTNSSHINLMGAKFSGIDLTDILWDEDGKIQISGIMIGRGKRVPRILEQGVLLPTTVENDPVLTHPLSSASNDFHTKNTGLTDSLLYHPPFDVGSAAQPINSRPNIHMFYSPGLLFERNVFEGTGQDDVNEDADQMELVALYGGAYNDNGTSGVINLSLGWYNKWYTKNYTINTDVKQFPYGTTTRIKRLLTPTTFLELDTSSNGEWHHYDEDNLDLAYDSFSSIDTLDCCAGQHKGRGVRNTWLLKTKDFTTATYYTQTFGLTSDPSRSRYYIANYIVHQEKYFTTAEQNSLSARISIGTGHFQPINQDVIDAIRLYNYSWTFPGTTFSSTTFTITINAVLHTSPAQTTLSGLTTWLNTLGEGTFVLTGSTITVSNVNNNYYSNIGRTTPALTITVSIVVTHTLNDVEVWGGDCYPWIFDFARIYPQFSGDCSTHAADCGGHSCWQDYGGAHVVPLETSMNIALRRGRNFANAGIRSEVEACGIGNHPFPNGIDMRQPEEFYLNSVVLHEGNVQAFVSLPEIIDPMITQFDYRWLYSNVKIPGEITDQYRTFLGSNWGDSEASFGKIVGRGYFADYMYCLQERGFSRLRINEIKMISTPSGEEISTGVTDVWQKPEKISTLHGTIYPYAIINTDKGIYWPDYYNKCWCRFAQDGVQDLTSQCEMKEWAHALLLNFDFEGTGPGLGPNYRHIAGGWDSTRKMLYWSATAQHGLVQIKSTIAYSANERVHSFVSFHDWYPKIYLNCRGWMLSSRFIDYGGDTLTLWTHYAGDRGNYYGTYRRTRLMFITNDVLDVDKLFDNAWASFNPDAYTLLETINLITDTQSVVITPVAGDARSDYRNLIFRNQTIGRPAPDNCNYTIDVGSPNFPLAAFTVIKNGAPIVVGAIANQAALQAYFVGQGFTDAYPVFTKTQTPDVWTSITWTGLGAPILFVQSGCISPIGEHLSGKYLQSEYIFLNAANKKIQFTSHDQSYRLIPKAR